MALYVGDANNSLKLGFEGLAYQSDYLRADAQVPYYTFSSHTFTAAGVTGRVGPTLAQLKSEYSAASWAQDSRYLDVVGPSGVGYGIQKWLVPKTGTYTIEAAGSPGGRGSDCMGGAAEGAGTYPPSGTQGVPGNGIIIRANFYLLGGDILYILVGQRGIDTPYVIIGSDTDGGGGGGTFVAKKMIDVTRYYFTPDSCYVVPLIVAGGGGGGSSDGNGAPAVYANWQGTTGWQNVNTGGIGLGGGFSTNHRVNDTTLPGYSIDSGFTTGATGVYGRRTGQSFLEGGLGGFGNYNGTNGNGGYGGGAGATDESGAGGGGWYGGLNGDNSGSYSSQGGTSYISPEGSSQTNVGYRTPASSTTQGYCTITFVS
mgnify:CR=1 FL=1